MVLPDKDRFIRRYMRAYRASQQQAEDEYNKWIDQIYAEGEVSCVGFGTLNDKADK